MIDKKAFLNALSFEDKNKVSKLYEKICFCLKTGREAYTEEFYPPNVWKYLEKAKEALGVNISSFGIFDEAERKVIAFSQEEIWHFPISLIKIQNKSEFTKLTHRDYLGSILSLGIKREKFGDLICEDSSAYVAVYEELADYIIYNLESVGNSPCIVEKVDIYTEDLPQHKFQEENIISTSFRLDSIVSSITGLSRSKALDIIREGKVIKDYRVETEKDEIVQENSILTIRGYGKYKIVCQVGITGSGRFKILLKKFI